MRYPITKTFERAGEILINIIWLEKRLIDMFIIRENPDLKDDFNKNTTS